MSIVQLKSQYRTVKDRASETPHQFRTRNNPNKPKRTRSKSNENQVKSTKLIDILPLITVWLQVRVLPGPPQQNQILGGPVLSAENHTEGATACSHVDGRAANVARMSECRFIDDCGDSPAQL
jgi:hypothetical protein